MFYILVNKLNSNLYRQPQGISTHVQRGMARIIPDSNGPKSFCRTIEQQVTLFDLRAQPYM